MSGLAWDEPEPELDFEEDDSARPGRVTDERQRARDYRKRKALREVAQLQRQAAESDRRRRIGHARVIAALQEMAMGGVMPSQSVFNLAKPAMWPTASAIVIALHTTWDDLAAEAGLQPSPRGRRVTVETPHTRRA